jgi:hypothetical protein
MSKLIDSGESCVEHHTSGRGLALGSVVVGAGLVALAIASGGRPAEWNGWTWGIGIVGLLQLVGGVLLVVRGATVWRFDLQERRVEPPPRSGIEPFALEHVEAIVLDAHSRLAPSLLLVACRDEVSHTLDVGGSLERGGLRIRGRALASRLGVPFVDRTTRVARGGD